MNHLEWLSETSKPDEKLIRSFASDKIEVSVPYGNTTYPLSNWTFGLEYTVFSEATSDGDAIFITVKFPNDKVIKEKVESFESGKDICENYRRNFFLDMTREINNHVGGI